MQNKFVSNLHIDLFIEKISNMGVQRNDIDDYLHRSVQFEITEDVFDKMAILDNLFFVFRTSYPDLYETLEDDINSVYFSNRPDF